MILLRKTQVFHAQAEKKLENNVAFWLILGQNARFLPGFTAFLRFSMPGSLFSLSSFSSLLSPMVPKRIPMSAHLVAHSKTESGIEKL